MLISLRRKIRSLAPIRLRKYIQKIGNFFGADLEPTYPSIDGALKYLRDWGFQPEFVVDIGAYHGEWTKLFKDIYPTTNILMIEGQDEKETILRESCTYHENKVFLEMALLGATDDETVRFIEMETGSSVFEEASPHKRQYVEKKLKTLDSVLKKYPRFTKIDFLKLDVQGYELNVLNGASKALGRTEFVLMETSLIPINQGCPIFSDVILFMTEHDFRLLDFCSQSRIKDGALWQTDLLFVSNSSRFIPRTSIDY